MDGRIGSLEVRYHARRLDPQLAARLPALTRAFELQLADALDSDLSATLGDGRDVYVVRELSVGTALDADWMLDRPVVERVSRASVEAVSAMLARPSENVRHFDDQAEFLCAFIVDELDGAAADRWYFGAFAPCRRADAAGTIDAVLAAHPGHVAATLGRLARRGRLDALLTALGARRIFAALDTAATAPPASGVGVLVDAALQLAGLTGWAIGGHRQTLRQALLARHRDAAPAWQDRRVLSVFVWACVEDAAEMLVARGVTRADGDRGALVRALRGELDWLDAPWLLEQCDEAGAVAVEGPTATAPSRLAIVLTRVAAAVAEGRVSCPESDDDALVVRLIAAAQLRAEEPVSVDALRAALGDAVREWRALLARSSRGPEQDDVSADVPRQSPRLNAGRPRPSAAALTPDAAVKALTQALAEHSAAAAGEGEPTRGAGLYLLSRVVLDAGLPGLAVAHGVPLSPLLALLAVRWLPLEWPLDLPALDWTGAVSRGETELDQLEVSTGLAALAEALHERLLAQGVVTAAGDEAGESIQRADRPAILDFVAASLLRAWARWLPGLREASAGFLRAKCLVRGGAVRRSATRIDVTLDPAPLDVVLQMAGYLRPIEGLPWCGGRAVSFVVRRQPSA